MRNTTMPSLKKLQKYFSEAIYHNEHKNLLSAIRPTDISNEERIVIYKNNVLITLNETLKSRYPATLKLVGEEFFKYATNEFIKKNQPTSGNLDEYGKSFIDFIEYFAPAKNFGYLSDVARLEWALHTAYFAADSDTINKQAFSEIPPENLENTKFTLHPSSALISSPYPVDKIWEISQNDYDGDSDIDINERGANILVVRPEYIIKTILLETGEFEFLITLQKGKTLYEAFEKASEVNQEFDIGAALQKFVLNGTFVDFSVIPAQA